MTTLHAGGKFSNKVYQTSGGLHGVGISVVNALSEFVDVEVYRDKKIYNQKFSKGHPTETERNKKEDKQKGTKIKALKPDPEIFDRITTLIAINYMISVNQKHIFLRALRSDGFVIVKSQKKKIFLKMTFSSFRKVLLT